MHIKLFSCCAVVKGSSRASIVDTQREQIFFIPLSLYNLINAENNSVNLLKIKQMFDEDSHAILDEYVDFLIDNELGFYCREEELELFPAVSQDFSFPAHISNFIIDSNGDTIKFFDSNFFSQLSGLCCHHLQLRIFSTINFDELKIFLDLINDNEIKSFEMIIPSNEFLKDEQNLVQILDNNRKLKALIITHSEEYKIVRADNYSGTAVLTQEKISGSLHCGIVQLNQFVTNIKHYTESLRYNNCLNRKMAIDVDGNIKNCPSMKESFGNIKNTSLQQALDTPGFKKYWNVNKDHITKCKDCEFRYVCTDCRAYTDNPGDMYAAPLKCGYDPYNCIWEEWSTNPLKKEGISHYGMQEIANTI